MAEEKIQEASSATNLQGENEECKRLMDACKEGNVAAVVEQLGKAEVPAYRENGKGKKETCLEVAVQHGQKKVAEAIVKHERWRECLKITSDNKNDNTPFRELIAKMPDTAIKVLDKCVTQPANEAFEFSFEFFGETPSVHYSSTVRKDEYSDAEDDTPLVNMQTSSFRLEDDYVVEKMEGDLLLHPVVLSFLRRMWLKYAAVFFFSSLGFYLIFLILLTAFALIVPNPQLPACRKDELNQTDVFNTSNISCDVSSGPRHFLIGAAVIIIISCLVRLFFELVELSHLKGLHQRISKGGWGMIRTAIDLEYFLSPSNYIEIPLFTLSIVFVSVIHHECLCPSRRQWQAGFIAVFLTWIDLVLYLDKLPLFGIYIQMLLKIIRNFLKVLVMAILLLLAFGFAFYMAFYEPDLPDTPFENPAVTLVEMISFAIGSPDISIFRLSNDDTRVETIPYPVLSYIIWVVFAIVMSVLFLNLLTGLAVEDVHKLQGQAQINRIKQQIKMLKKIRVWSKRLKTIIWCHKLHKKMPDTGNIPPNDKLSKKTSYWHIFNLFIGDEIEDIIKRATEVQKKKAQQEMWTKSNSGSAPDINDILFLIEQWMKSQK